MAKQRGPHQIKGRINNLSYYEQKDIRGGLIRRINEGMSSRLKDDPVFANTREANAFFGICSRFASLVISIVSLRWGTLTRGNRQAILTRGIWGLVQTYTSPSIKGDWDNAMDIWSQFSYVFNQIVRTPLDRFISTIPNWVGIYDDNVESLTFLSGELIKIREYFDVGALEISVLSPCAIGPVIYNRDTGKYDVPSVSLPNRPITFIYNQKEGDVDINLDKSRLQHYPLFAFVSIKPIKTISKDGTYSVYPNKGLLKCICLTDY